MHDTYRDRVRALARAFREAHWPLTPQRMARGIGYTLAYTDLGGPDGMLDPVGKRVLIAAGQSPRRQRFTLAHEVIHHLIQHDDELLSDLHDAFEGPAFEEALEALCNLGAAEMLLPSRAVVEAVAQHGYRPRLIPELAERYGVSEEVAAIALAEHGPGPALALIAGGRPLRVLFSARGKGMRARLPKARGIAADHPLTVARETGLPFRGKAPLPGGRTPLYLWAQPLHGKVYALYWVA
ncbi:ImmA/IrrE family metallo-endopeptidase [Marinithermus hydrothermalis]|uniref:IrrE N-terminal-like domain-containing protein n=1 Tax=Marinithermus hydrothermalis (strain DSM 14884 / JCM 11576 / T1) TaxID=869210 RepID=F2NL73_MARHT|nr:ImmA/IrrE family metallo-endopeptidase [Marinithermus hydrothermalis]AEB11476.1 protein of unknown function DUF955 [Marinithermus hydrothermalis DSM 14884]